MKKNCRTIFRARVWGLIWRKAMGTGSGPPSRRSGWAPRRCCVDPLARARRTSPLRGTHHVFFPLPDPSRPAGGTNKADGGLRGHQRWEYPEVSNHVRWNVLEGHSYESFISNGLASMTFFKQRNAILGMVWQFLQRIFTATFTQATNRSREPGRGIIFWSSCVLFLNYIQFLFPPQPWCLPAAGPGHRAAEQAVRRPRAAAGRSHCGRVRPAVLRRPAPVGNGPRTAGPAVPNARFPLDGPSNLEPKAMRPSTHNSSHWSTRPEFQKNGG